MRISVVTISYNQAGFLPACIESVGTQLRAGDEHICVDPGSTDGSRALILARDSLRPVFEPDQGPADGLNKGFERAGGDILAFINADDELAPGACEYVRDFFSAHPEVDLLIGAVRVIDAEGRVNGRKKVPSAPRLSAVAHGTAAFYQQGLFFRRRVWTELGIRFNTANRTCWDYEFFADALIAGAVGQATARELGWFRIHPQSITGSGRLNDQYACDRARIERAAATAGGATSRKSLRDRLTKFDPVRRLCEFSSWGDAPEFASLSGTEERCERRRVVVAWQGLPFYARRCLRALTKLRPDWDVVAITSAMTDDLAAAEADCGCRIQLIDSEKPQTFGAMGMPVPHHFFATSWTHAAYRRLGEETRRAGGGVTMLADNRFAGTARQWLGAIYFRTVLGTEFDDVWVPGKAGQRFMEVMGVGRARTHTQLLTGDGDVFHPPAENMLRAGVVYAGQLIHRKRVLELWRAWQAVAVGETLAMIGEGALRDELVAAQAPVERGLNAIELAARFRSASALILVSTEDHWGLVVHEAALCGCLILITSTCGATDDLVVHRKNGYVMKDFSESELRDGLAWMRGLTTEAESAGRALSVGLAKQFSPQRWAQRAVEIMRIQSAEKARAVV